MDYDAVNKEEKKSVGREKNKYIEDLAQEAEEAVDEKHGKSDWLQV